MTENNESPPADFPPTIKNVDEYPVINREGDPESSIEERPRGILSHTDREYLLGLRDYKHAQSEANRKQDIRERVVNGFQDFAFLVSLLSDEERDKIFNEEMDDEGLQRCLELMIAFVYRGLDQDKDRLENIIENGVFIGANFDKGDRWAGAATNVDTLIDIDYNPDVEKLYQRFQQGAGEELTPAEIGVLVRSGKLEPADLEKLEETGPTIHFGSSR